jgi:WhiB family redox-sensing transcriptional regulator
MFTDQQLDLANCKDTDPDLFFPNDEGKYMKKTVKLVKEICNACEIKDLCLQQAIADDMRGIWGGMTEVERTMFVNGTSFRPRTPSARNQEMLKYKNAERALKASTDNLKYFKRALEILHLPESTVELLTERIKRPEASMGALGESLSTPLTRDAITARLRRVIKEVKEIDGE